MLVLLFWALVNTAAAEDLVAPIVKFSELADGRPDAIEEGFIGAYEASAGYTVAIGDTLILGAASGTSAIGTGTVYARGAVAKQFFQYVYNGTQAATVAKALLVSDPSMYLAPSSISGVEVRVTAIKLAGSRKRPIIWMESEFVESAQKSNATGILTIWDFETAARTGEVTSPKNITSEMAIAKLKEAKELLDMGVYTQAQFDEAKARYAPFVK
jgi:hypothetical protein